MSQSQGFKFDRPVEVLTSGPIKTYPVDTRKWHRWIERLESASDSSLFFFSAGWTLAGISASAFLTAILLPFSSICIPFWIKTICWGIFAVASISSGLCFYFSNTHRNDREKIRAHVIEDMKDVRDKYSPNSDSTET
jgi:hypothetical protein